MKVVVNKVKSKDLGVNKISQNNNEIEQNIKVNDKEDIQETKGDTIIDLKEPLTNRRQEKIDALYQEENEIRQDRKVLAQQAKVLIRDDKVAPKTQMKSSRLFGGGTSEKSVKQSENNFSNYLMLGSILSIVGLMLS